MPEIAAVNGTFETFADAGDVPTPIANRFNLAFEELLKNFVSYAYRDDDEHGIEVEMELAGKRPTVRRRLVEPLPSVHFVDRRRRGPSVAEGEVPWSLTNLAAEPSGRPVRLHP